MFLMGMTVQKDDIRGLAEFEGEVRGSMVEPEECPSGSEATSRPSFTGLKM